MFLVQTVDSPVPPLDTTALQSEAAIEMVLAD